MVSNFNFFGRWVQIWLGHFYFPGDNADPDAIQQLNPDAPEVAEPGLVGGNLAQASHVAQL